MAYKTIHETFWTDPKVKTLSPKERFLFLYFITNPHSHYSGLYYLPLSVISEETGLSQSDVRKGIDTLSKGYFIRFDPETSVIWVVKMARYQVNGEKMVAGIPRHFKALHNSLLIKDFLEFYKNLKIPYRYPIDTLCRPHADGIPVAPLSIRDVEVEEEVKDILSGKPDAACEVVAYLNQVLGTDYKPTTRKTREIIQARFMEGFTVGDFKTVINRKANKWRGDPKMAEYLRPITLFGTKFESYLNEQEAQDAKNQRGNQDARTLSGGVRGEPGKYAGVTRTFEDDA